MLLDKIYGIYDMWDFEEQAMQKDLGVNDSLFTTNGCNYEQLESNTANRPYKVFLSFEV